MNEPYREPAEKTEKLIEPLVSPLTEFKKHEKMLALMRVYRQDLVECIDDKETLDELKERANAFFMKRTLEEDRKRGPVLEAIAWMNQVTLDDLYAFEEIEEDEEPEEPEPEPEQAIVDPPKGLLQRTWVQTLMWTAILLAVVDRLVHCHGGR